MFLQHLFVLFYMCTVQMALVIVYNSNVGFVYVYMIYRN